LLAAVIFFLANPATHAELSSEDYAGSGAIQTEAERERVRALIESARQREAERAEALARERAAEDSRHRDRLAEENARRPPGAVLAETHCGVCHAMEAIATRRHTALGWSMTIARMRWLNGARIPPEDAARIREHLAQTQPAHLARAIVEYGLFALVILLPGGWAFRRLYRRLSNASSGRSGA
jgi:hypothetical protein